VLLAVIHATFLKISCIPTQGCKESVATHMQNSPAAINSCMFNLMDDINDIYLPSVYVSFGMLVLSFEMPVFEP